MFTQGTNFVFHTMFIFLHPKTYHAICDVTASRSFYPLVTSRSVASLGGLSLAAKDYGCILTYRTNAIGETLRFHKGNTVYNSHKGISLFALQQPRDPVTYRVTCKRHKGILLQFHVYFNSV